MVTVGVLASFEFKPGDESVAAHEPTAKTAAIMTLVARFCCDHDVSA
jgi:hypothetical protein